MLLVLTTSSYQSKALVVQIFKSSSAPTCPGGTDGYVVIDSILTADLVVTTGPPPPLRFIININTTPSQSFNVGDTIKNLGSNIYTISILDLTDNSSAFDNVNYTGVGLSTSAFQIPASCFGNCDGTARVVTNLGGTPPYTYQWDDPSNQTTSTAINLCAGPYNVTVSDANGCTSTNSTTVGEPTQILPNVTSNDPSCNGGNNGTATANPTGGSGVYPNFAWSSSANTTSTETGLSPGSYTVTVTDNTGCTNTENFVIGNPALLATSLSVTPILCFGTNTGSIIQTPSGGTPPYTFAWNDSPTSQNRNNLFAGDYTVTVTDNNGCTTSATRNVGQRPDIVINLSVLANNVCNGGAIGAVSASISGGTSPYTFAWRGGPSGNGNTTTFSNLTAGFYPITVTDRFNCTKVDSIEVAEPTAIAITVVSQTDPTCNGGSDGAITISAAGGTVALDYTYAWNAPGNPTTAAITNLAAGTYIVTVTDDNLCTATQSVTLNPPVPIIPNVVTTLVTCFGGNDGTATASPTGGTPPYTYSWSTSGNTTFIETGLSAGNYFITVSDVNGCTGVEPFTISQPATAFTTSFSINPILCFGDNTGSIITNVSGGVPPYTFDWADIAGQSNPQNRNNLIGGLYDITVTDNAGCTSQNTANVQQRPDIVLAFNQTDILCAGDATGSATVNISGGTSPYSFVWTGNITGNGANSTINNLTAGTYRITVTDRFNCDKIDSVIITEPAALNITVNSVDPTCVGINDGTATAIVSGGTLNYTYAWSTTPIQTTATATNLGAGTFTVTVTDNNGCTITDQGILNASIGVTITLDSISDVSCNGGNDGYIGIVASSGVLPYTYIWNNAITTDINPNLLAGDYTVTVSDNNGCLNTQTFTINQPSALSVSLNKTDQQCFGDADGEIIATGSGGTAPYTFSWFPNVGTTDTVRNLNPGFYTATITDDNGCTATSSTTIGIANPRTVVAGGTDVSCNGGNDGAIAVIALGGAGGFSFDWNDIGSGPQIRTGLIAGTYTVTSTDANGCTDVQSVIIGEPDTLKANLITSDVSCSSTNDGTASLTPTGGTAPYTFNWGPPINSSANPVNGLSIGNYTVTVTDNNGCTDVENFTINKDTADFTITLSSTDVSCNGGNDGTITTTVNGGIGPFTYTWNPVQPDQPNISGLTAGTYQLTVSDPNGCTRDTSIVLGQPAPLLVTGTAVDETCSPGGDGTITLTTTGGTPNYTFNWVPILSNSPNQTGLSANTYFVTVTDANVCTDSANFVIGSQGNAFTIALTATDISCNGAADGSILVSETPAGTYNYNWTGGLSGNNPTVLIGGTYTVTVTDPISGCTQVDSATVNEPTIIAGNIVTTPAGCGTASGTVTSNPSGGNGTPYTFNWNVIGTVSNNTVTNVPPGTYDIT